MKKLFAILAIASVMTACNSSEDKTTTTDTTKTENPLMDATTTADSVNKIMNDTAHKVMDTTIKK